MFFLVCILIVVLLTFYKIIKLFDYSSLQHLPIKVRKGVRSFSGFLLRERSGLGKDPHFFLYDIAPITEKELHEKQVTFDAIAFSLYLW
jgi:hypothetical protein